MTLTDLLTLSADAAAQRYGMLTDAFRFSYSQALDSRQFGSGRLINSVTEQAYEIASSYQDNEATHIGEEMTRFSESARVSTLEKLSETDDNDSQALSDHLDATGDYLAREISIQIERDIAFLRQSLMKTQLHVGLVARAHRLPPEAALIRYRTGNASELHFFYHDRAGRAFPSRRFIRQTWRHNLLAAYNETVLMTMAQFGLDRAIVRHPDPAHPNNGVVVSMHAGSSLQNYPEIRDRIFHPSSRAFLEVA